MERTELPTPQRLEELRAEGIVPYSPAATASVALLALVAALVLGAAWGFEQMQGLVNWIRDKGDQPSVVQLSLLIVAPCIAAALGAIVLGVAQTRATFRTQYQASRAARLRAYHEIAPIGLMGTLLTRVLWLTLCLLMLSALLWSLGPTLFSFVSIPYQTEPLLALGRRLAMWVLLCGLVIAVGGVLVSKLSFRLANRMTREEVRAESE